ncbi:MAG: hypothetical protein JSV78_03000 [Phycisphaerales bacterium]|nr:MAG: hypothetical protein JSV78_03000 [Phycisphaerales bacterium]
MSRMHRALSVLLTILVAAATVGLAVYGGCTAISISPTCPASLMVGESGEVRANAVDPGGAPRYQWEVIPAAAGTFANAQAADTSFQALKEGDATLRLTASDGLFFMMNECTTRIEGTVGGLVVVLSAGPEDIMVDETATLTCASVGGTEAVSFVIFQTEGQQVELAPAGLGVRRFTPDRAGDLVFECIGIDAEGEQSDPARISLVVQDAPVANENENENVNDNVVDNENVNDNVPDNENDNEAANDNSSDEEEEEPDDVPLFDETP